MAKKPKTETTTPSPTSSLEAGETPTAPAGETLEQIREDAIVGPDSPSDPQGNRDGGTEPRRRRGRPPGKTKTKQAREVEPVGTVRFDPSIFAPVVTLPFDYLAARRGEHWKLSEDERAALASAVEKVVSKYAGALAERWGDEFALALCLAAVVSGRVMTDVDNTRKARESLRREVESIPPLEAVVNPNPEGPA